MIALLKKEFLESIRTYKLVVIMPIFMFFGITNPIFAKIMPELFKTMEGVSIEFATPTLIDAWAQFYQNIISLILIFIILFGNTISNEVLKGTFINLLSKGVSRTNIILSKFLFVTFIWTICYSVNAILTYIISINLLDGEISNSFIMMVITWLIGVLLIAIMILGSVLFKNLYGSIISVFLFHITCNFLKFVPIMKEINPYLIISNSVNVLKNEQQPIELLLPVGVCIVLIFILIRMSIGAFKKVAL